MSTTGVVITRP